MDHENPSTPPPQRKHPTHGVEPTIFKPTIVFVTVCTKDRRPWLANAAVHDLLRSVWLDARAWRVGRYVIMPDHLHFFTSPGEPDLPLENWIRFWKSQLSKRYKEQRCRWQTDHWDQRLRSGENYDEKWNYVRLNPVRHQLVKKAEDWPHRGELNILRWD